MTKLVTGSGYSKAMSNTHTHTHTTYTQGFKSIGPEHVIKNILDGERPLGDHMFTQDYNKFAKACLTSALSRPFNNIF